MYSIKAIKDYFVSELSSDYSKEESNTYFYLLFEEFTGIEKIDIVSDIYAIIDDSISDKIKSAVNRLKQNEPVQYITGNTWFYDLKLKVNPDVMIPRPETEELIDRIIKDCNNQFQFNIQHSAFSILDIGTGSGCIAIALKKNLPFADVYAIDISERALDIAKQNAILNNSNITFLQMDILNNKKFSIQNLTFNIIVSNPPYVRESEKSLIQPNVLKYEPHSSIFVNDDDPLKFYKAISDFAFNGNLIQEGRLYFEINEYLGNDIINLLNLKGFKNIHIINDINNKPRIISCFK